MTSEAPAGNTEMAVSIPGVQEVQSQGEYFHNVALQNTLVLSRGTRTITASPKLDRKEGISNASTARDSISCRAQH